MPRLSFVLGLMLLALPVFASTQATLFVSPDGSGTSFSQGQPGNLFEARDYVRTLTTNMTGDIVVYLLGGTYQFTNSVQLRESAANHDSGTGGFNVIYQAFSGQTPVISGGLVVTNWSLFDAATNLWRAFVGTDVNSRQLYVNGVRAIRARSALNPSGFTTNSAGTGFNTTNTAMQSWGNPTNIEIVQRHNWKQLRCPIASITGTNIVMQTPGWTYTGVTPAPGRPWNGNGKVSLTGVSWVENAQELLAGPGLWYLNRATGYLYYIPRPGEDLTNGAVVVLPVVEKLIDASGGDPATPIHNLVISGVTFKYATWLLPSTSAGYADNQTSILWSGPTNALKTLGNISFQTASFIQITNCVFEHLGGSAIDFGGGARSNLIVGNRIEDISSDGIAVGEVTDYATTDPSRMTDGNVIRDNYIRRPGQDYEDAIGIWMGYSRNTVIAHNDIDNTPYTGISLGWGWGTPTYSENNRVLANYVGKVMQTLTDGGSCYTLSAQTNSWEIANDYKDSCYQGIYWDEGTSFYTGVSNVFDNCLHNYINLHSSGGTVPLNDQYDTASNNFANVTAHSNFNTAGTNCVLTNTVYVTAQFWPPAAQQIILNAGLEPAFARLESPEYLVNDTEPDFDHVPSDWAYASARNLGEYHNDVHYTQTDGQYLQYTFTAAGIAWIGELNDDAGNVDVYLDGNFQQTVNCHNATRVAQARLFSVTNLTSGPHTLKLVNNGGAYLTLDAFAVTPVNFWLTATTNAATVAAGNTFSNMVKLDVFGGYAGTTVLSASGLPAGADASFSPPSLTGAGFSIMTVTTAGNTPAGNYEFNVVGIGGGVTNIATVGLAVVGSANERWNSTTSGAWDLTASNWFNLGSGRPDVFHTGDNVFFDDTAGVVTDVTIAGGVTVQPATVTVSAETNRFSITGAGAIGGPANLVKSGSSTLLVGTTNTFTGNVTISGGTLRAGTASALGSAGGTTLVTNGGTLDVNGFNLTAEPVIVSGAGFNSNGAIVNSGASQISALRQVTLAGDATFGGTNRWDIRNTGGTANLSTSPAGSAFKITKVGTSQVSLVAVSVIEPALGDIDIQQGEFAIQTSTVQVGDPNKTITVRSNATLEVWNLTNTPLNKIIVLNEGATVFNESGASQIVGPVTLLGNDTFNVGGTSLTFSNAIGGTGNLIKTGASPLNLTGTNTYTGATTVNTGTLMLAGNGSISGSSTVTVNSGTVLDVSGRADKTLTLAGGQTLQGNGTINGSLQAAPNATVMPGVSAIGILTVTNGVTLQGTTCMKLSKAPVVTNDMIRGAQTISYGGTLSLTNLAGTLQPGDSFNLFSAAACAGAFTNILPAVPAAGLAWYTNGLTHGTLSIVASDFALGATPLSQTAPVGGGASYTVTITPTNGFSGTVTLSVSGLPAGFGYSLNPTNVSGPGTSTLSVTISNTVADGDYPLTLTGASGSLAHLVNLTITATADNFDPLRVKWWQSLTGGTNFNLGDSLVKNSLRSLTNNATNYWYSMNKSPARTYLWSDLTNTTVSAQITSAYSRLKAMALAYSTCGSSLRSNATLAADIQGGLDWMYANRYNESLAEYDNWWDWEIGTPILLTDLAVLMYDGLGLAGLTNSLNAVNHFTPSPTNGGHSGTFTGANLADKLRVVAVRGVVVKDPVKLASARDALSLLFPYVTSGDGFYVDGSFIQHTRHPYNGGYGAVLLGDVSLLMPWLQGSPWQCLDPAQTNIFQWVYGSFEPFLYSGAMMDMTRGRGVSRSSSQDHSAGAGIIQSILSLSPFAPAADAARMRSMVKYWAQADTFRNFTNGVPLPLIAPAEQLMADPDTLPRGELIGHWTFASMDRVVHLRPGWGFGLSLSSSRIYNYESINSENLHGWFEGDGMTYLYNGDLAQFNNNFWPTVDPYGLPGATVDTTPRANSAGQSQISTKSWVGGATLFTNGAAGMALAPYGSSLVANKSWFMFDDEVVCLGAGIACSSTAAVQTVVENRKISPANTNALVMDGVTMPATPGWSTNASGATWCALDGAGGYYFPGGANVSALRQARTNSWYQIDAGYSTNLVSNNFVTLLFNHGVQPTHATYAYVLLPNFTAAQSSNYAASPEITILENSTNAQAVQDTTLHVVAANFWVDAVQTQDLITCNRKASVLTQEGQTRLSVAISDPTQTNTGSILVTLDRAADSVAFADPAFTVSQISPTIQFSVNVNGARGRSLAAGFNLHVSAPPDFTLAATPPSQKLVAGNTSVSYTVNLSSTNGFTNAVSLGVSGLPAGATAGFDPPSVAVPGSSTLTVTNGDTIAAGDYTLILAATGGNLTNTTSVTLNVTPWSPPWITSLIRSGINLVLSGTNGVPGGGYYVLATTNVAWPLAGWTPIATNAFDFDGNFSFTNGMDPNLPGRFYILRLP